MELLADRDPEVARKLLDPILGHMMEAVHRYEGTVNQVMGDGIMALFGAPLAHALAFSRKQVARGEEAWSLYLLGAINAGDEPGSVAASDDYYHQGLALAGELGMRPLVAHCHLGLGKLYRRTGQRDQAQENLATATSRTLSARWVTSRGGIS